MSVDFINSRSGNKQIDDHRYSVRKIIADTIIKGLETPVKTSDDK